MGSEEQSMSKSQSQAEAVAMMWHKQELFKAARSGMA